MRRTAISRLVLITTIASLAAGLIGTTVVAARDPGSDARQLRPGARPAFAGSSAGPSARTTEARHVNVRDLAAARGLTSPSAPRLLKPDSISRSPRTTTNGVPAPVEYTETANPAATEGLAYDGIADTGLEPPDPWVAVGPEHILQAVNTTFELSDRSGTSLGAVDMFDFFLLGDFYFPGEVAYFDPHVIYDSLHGRWIAIEASYDCFGGTGFDGAGYLDVAISDSADPTLGWYVFSIPFGDFLPDYPGIGTSTDKVVISANIYELEPNPGPGLECAPATYAGTDMEVMAWSELIGSQDEIFYDSLYSNNFGVGSSFADNFFAWRPSLQVPATSSTVYAIAEQYDEGVGYARITGTPAGGGVTAITTADLTLAGAGVIAPFDQPPAPQQPGDPATIVLAVDGRPTDAIWQNNQLAFVSTIPCDPAGGDLGEIRDCVRVAELSTAVPASPTLLQDFLIAEPDTDHYMGGIGYAGNGDLHVVWTRSSENGADYPSSYTAYQLASDAANALSAPDLLAPGSGTYPGTRWGDYVGVAQDPQVPNAVWQANEFSAGGAGWATHVSQLVTEIGSSYVPITPLRIVDSRSNLGVTGIFSASVPKTFDVAGEGTIPADAIAVTGNVTVVNQTAAGFVAITPTATATPPSSTINFPLGDIRANNFTASLDQFGDLAAVYKAVAGKKTHVIVDITGYFLAGDGHATYTTSDPVRVMDSRPTSHVGTATIFQAGVPQTLLIAGEFGIPAEATAITGNLTVVGQSKAGYLSVTPDPPVGIPASSTLNFPLGDIRANTGLLFYPLNPGRVLDSRPGIVLSGLTGAFASNSARTLEVAGHWGVPAGAEAITGNLTVVNQTAAGFAAVTPVATNTPSTSTLNFPLGDIRANGITVPLDAGSSGLVYKAIAGKTTHLILDVTGYFR
jgi:hypothetical protein